MTTELHYRPIANATNHFMGPFDLQLLEDGGLISSAKIGTGYAHRSIERLLEKVNPMQAIAFCDKIDFLSPQSGSLAYALAVEKLAGIEIPERANFIRVILLELNRISNHIFYFASMAKELNHEPAYHFCLREKEKYSDLFDLYCGSRLGFGSIQVGGVAENASEGFLYRIEKIMLETEAFIAELGTILHHTPIFQSRLAGEGILPQHLIDEYQISGINARASGLAVDRRIQNPYAAYKNINMEWIKTEKIMGDALSRYDYRIKEIFQSMANIKIASKQIPPGNHKLNIGHDFHIPSGDAYVSVESPRGKLSVWLSSEGGTHPSRVKFNTPSFHLLALVEKTLTGIHVEDVFLILASFDLSFSEVDR